MYWANKAKLAVASELAARHEARGIIAIVVVTVPCLVLGMVLGVEQLMFLLLAPVITVCSLAAIVGLYCKFTAGD